jgi:putative glutamine amidotransferase
MVGSDRPVIGITTGSKLAWAEGGRYYRRYAGALREAGAEPVRLAPGDDRAPARALRELDGLLLSGGVDVDLRLYPRPPRLNGQAPEEMMDIRRMEIEPLRDRLEIPLVQAAVEADLPLLGICRGCQVLHVALGGQLILDIPSELPGALPHEPGPLPVKPSRHHQAEIRPDSLLARATGLSGRQLINTRHHQAVIPDDESPLQVSAVSPADKVVEGVELPEARWVIGVQWHPEREDDAEVRALFRPLFEAFVQACR